MNDGVLKYPYSSTLRLIDSDAVLLDPIAFGESDFVRGASFEALGAFMNLLAVSQSQTPVGTLPVDRCSLACQLGLRLEKFNEICAGDFGALHGWVEVDCGGEIRLVHQLTLDSIEEFIERGGVIA